MAEPGALAASLKQGGSEAAASLTALASESRPAAAQFVPHATVLLEFLDSAPEQPLQVFAVAALCSLIEKTELGSPEPLASVAPYALQPLIHALALTPPVVQLPAALETLWLASRSETEQALRQWGLVSSDAALRLAALGQLERWVTELNGHFAFRKFTPLVVSLLRDSAELVRNSAYRLIVKFFASTSARAREDLAEIMRKQQISEVTREKIMAAIAREMRREVPLRSPNRPESRPSPRLASPRLASPRLASPRLASAPNSASAPSAMSRPHTPLELMEPASSKGEAPLDLDLDVLRDSAYAMQPLEPVNVFSEDEFLSEVSSRLGCFEGKETEGNWSQRQDAVQRFRQMLRCQYVAISPPTLRTVMKMMQRPFSETMLSLRTTLVGFTCQALKDIALSAPPHMLSELLDPFLEPICHVACGIKKITASAAHICMCAILISTPSLSARQFQTIQTATQSKKPHARTCALYWLRAALVTSQQPVHTMDDKASSIEKICTSGITDAVNTAREEGRQLYWAIYQLWPALAHTISSRLPASAIKALQSSRPKDKKVAAPEASTPSTPALHTRSPLPPTLSPGPVSVTDEQLIGAATPTERQVTGLGIVNTELRASTMSGATQSTPKVTRVPHLIPATRESSTGISDSIADLSLREPGSSSTDNDDKSTNNGNNTNKGNSTGRSSSGSDRGGSNGMEVVDLADRASVRAVVKEHGALTVLRKLATSPVSPSTSSAVIRLIRDESAEVSSAADIAKLIQTDLSGASMTQRAGYLQLLERLNYEQDTVESVRPATSPAPSSIRRMRPRTSQIAVYVDSESDVSPQSLRSNASVAASPSSSMSSIGEMDMDVGMSFPTLDIPTEVTELFKSASISPFPSTEPSCKAYIEGLVQQVERQTAGPEVLAALAVLVTASAGRQSRKSPLFSAVDVWHRSYTFDMHLRDVILRYLSTRTDTKSVLVALILLRVLIVTPTQAPASAYLDPLACMQCLLDTLHVHGGKALEIDEVALPAACNAVMKSGRSFGSRSLLELLAASFERESGPAAKAFVIQMLGLAVTHTGLLADESSGVLPLVLRALDDGDARVRKEVYPVLVAIQQQNELLGAHVQTRMHAGQRRLLQHYLSLGQTSEMPEATRAISNR